MSTQAEDGLLQLLLQLKKTTPEHAQEILNSQPHVAYALISLMVTINAVDVDVLQKTVTSFAAHGTLPPQPTQLLPQHRSHVPVPAPIPAVAPYQEQVNGKAQNPPVSLNPAQGASPALNALAGISEEQRAMIMRVIAMTPDEINRLSAADRASVMQLRATLGLPST